MAVSGGLVRALATLMASLASEDSFERRLLGLLVREHPDLGVVNTVGERADQSYAWL